MRWTVAAVAALGLAWTLPADAAVLCKRKSGVVVVREDACKKKETALDLAQFGALGPKGDKGDPGIGPLTTCPPDSVVVGPACVDKYEASVWLFQPSDTELVAKVKAGTVTLADLTAGGAVQLGCAGPPYNQTVPPVYFPDNGQWTPILGSNPPSPGVYAVSIPGVLPSECITWFQADQACGLAGKRLPTNAEWQRAVAGTPDPGDGDDHVTTCNTLSGALAVTGSRAACVSAWGAFDMVGNSDEWTTEWVQPPTFAPGWGAFSDDYFGLSGASTAAGGPGVVFRGGGHGLGTLSGPFALQAGIAPYGQLGFRCVR